MRNLHTPLAYFLMIAAVAVGFNLGATAVAYAISESTDYTIELGLSQALTNGVMMFAGLLFLVIASIGTCHLSKHISALVRESKNMPKL